MKSLYRIFLLAALLFSVGISAQVRNLSITEVPEELWNEAVLVDVRTPGEYEEGYIPGAMLIDISSDDFVDRISKIAKDCKVLLYCRSGRRSADASAILDSLGYTQVYNLEGGYERWKARKQKND